MQTTDKSYINNKIQNRLNKALEGCNDPFFKNIELINGIEDKIFVYQYLHIVNLLTALDLNNVVLDSSDTGTGKTYTTAAICANKKLQPLVICPKAAIYTWKKVLKYFNVIPFDIINYESVMQKYENWNKIKNNKIIFIFDEAHKCKNPKTINAKILLSTKYLINKKILLSATLIDKISDFSVFGYMLGFYNDLNKGSKWTKTISKEINNSFIKKEPLKELIFPYKGSRMSICEISDFPENTIILQKNKLNSDKKENLTNLSDIIALRQILENKKIDLFVDMTIDYLDNNLSVVIFVNYIENLNNISLKLKKRKIEHVVLHGNIIDSEREKNIELFQSNKVNVIICSFGVGGASISLHDLYGRARVSILSLPESSITFNQSLGRICRTGSKSPALQVIPFYIDTYENTIYKRLNNKISDLANINCLDFKV